MSFVLQPERYCFSLRCPWLLASSWFTGFVAGIFICNRAVPFVSSWMRGMALDSVSIVGLIVSAMLPFLISAFAVIVSRPLLFHIVCFLKAFCFVWLSLFVMIHYREGGWLIQWFVMFSEILTLPILYTFWLRCFRFGKLPSVSECFCFMALEILVLTMTYRLTDPFLTALEIL